MSHSLYLGACIIVTRASLLDVDPIFRMDNVGIVQSLICTCRLQGINPYTYLVDVLQRIAIHPDSAVEQLTPRVWKTLFADEPLRSDLAFVTAKQPLLQDVAV